MSDTTNLKTLGSTTKYDFTEPNSKILETFQNQHPNNLFLVPFVMPDIEFTSLCPKTGQPDWAKIEIIYVPNDLMIESKSLKLYLYSYRNHGEFHEDCINRIANDIYNLITPKFLRVIGDFNSRGGLAIKPMVYKGDTSEIIWNIVRDFDNKFKL